MSRENEIKNYWEEQARLARDGGDQIVIVDAERNVFADSSSGGTMKDWRIRELEIQAFERRINKNDLVLDVGCGNGLATVQLAQRTGCPIHGIDYSVGMVNNAKQLLNTHYPDLVRKVHYSVGDVTDLTGFSREKYDVVITERCLINLVDWENQKHAIAEISRILSPGGIFLMLEGSMQGLNNLNQVRQRMSLSTINSPWHNQFIDDELLLDYSADLFDLLLIDNFCSMYMLISRVLHPKLVEPDSPRYDSKINDIGLQLPNSGEYGYLKLFVFRRK